jgi:hypothetical protein
MATGRIGTTPVLQVRWSKAPSDGTTSLSGLDDNSVSLVYSVGYEAVYRNGVLLSRGNDYTATDGTTVTLIDATITGDIIEIFANQTIPLSDTYSQTVSDGKFINNTLTTTTGDIIYASGANTPARLAIGTSADVLTVSGGIPAWAAPAGGGKVLQVVYSSTATVVASSSSTQADTNLTATITPSSATSKVLVLVAQNGVAKNAGNSSNSVDLYLYRGATELVRFQANATHTNTTVRNDIGSCSTNYLDTPATTSATTYKTTFRNPNNTAEVYVQEGGGSTSTMILMEIGA